MAATAGQAIAMGGIRPPSQSGPGEVALANSLSGILSDLRLELNQGTGKGRHQQGGGQAGLGGIAMAAKPPSSSVAAAAAAAAAATAAAACAGANSRQ